MGADRWMALVASLLGSWVIWNKNKKHQNLLRKPFEPMCRLTSKRTSRTTAIFNMVPLSLSFYLLLLGWKRELLWLRWLMWRGVLLLEYTAHLEPWWWLYRVLPRWRMTARRVFRPGRQARSCRGSRGGGAWRGI